MIYNEVPSYSAATRIDIFANHIGKYIRFGGFGIIDGLVQKKSKAGFYRIMGFSGDSLILRRYRGRIAQGLDSYHWHQAFEIIDSKEFKKLPKY